MGPDRGGFLESVQQVAPRVVNSKHSVNVEAQVTALQAEAAAENDYIDRGDAGSGNATTRRKNGKHLVHCRKGEREQSPRISHRRGRLRAPRWKPVDTWARG